MRFGGILQMVNRNNRVPRREKREERRPVEETLNSVRAVRGAERSSEDYWISSPIGSLGGGGESPPTENFHFSKIWLTAKKFSGSPLGKSP